MDTIGVSQTDFLSGEISMTFDLEKARDAAKFDDHMAITMFPLAIAEIERLRADYDKLKSSLLVIDGCKKLMNQAARIDELEADNQNLVTLNKSLMNNDWILRDNNRKYRKRAQKAELLNKELKADLEQSERVVEARLDVIDQQAAKIRELEDALRDAIQPGDADKIDTFLRDCMCPDSEGPNECCMCPEDTIEFCDLLKRVRVASQQLQAEGKIGPDARPKCDHEWQAALEERGYQTCLKCGECRDIKDIPRTPAWQITEDRVTAIDQGLRFLEWSNAKTGHVETKKRIAILKTMLEEASDKHGFER
jgi:hypothetical protein